MDGNLAYLATGAAGLEIVDIGDADHPILSGFYDAPEIASSVSVEDGRDYLAEGDVQILDTNLPGQPKLLGSIPTQPGSGVIRRWAADVQMIGFIAYIIYGVRDEDHLSTSLSLVDISDPAHPFVISSIDANAVLKVRVVNDFAYLSASYLTSSIIDVHDPVHPVRVSELGCRFRDISLQSCLR